MDLHNNGVGIRLARLSNGYFQAFWDSNEARRVARSRCLGALRNGALWWLVPTPYYGRFS